MATGAVAKKLLATSTGLSPKAVLKEVGGSGDYEEILKQAKEKGDSLGGVVEVRVEQLPAGLGEPIFHKMEALLAQAMLSLPAIGASNGRAPSLRSHVGL